MNLKPSILLAAVAGIVAPAWAQSPDVALGRDMAHQWCAGCHQVEASDPMNELAPAFADIANDPERTPERLQIWLTSEHPQMPDFNLGDREVAALIAYLESLRVQ